MAKDHSIIDPRGAVNQAGLRDQNARLVLSFIRRHGAMPSAEIARRSGLSAQTVSNIIRALESDGLLLRGEGQRGKVGKPSVPVTLNPQGVHAFGLNIGRRSAELVLVDFTGSPLETVSASYAYPTTEGVFAFLEDAIKQVCAKHPEAQKTVTGIGVARPNKLWKWLEVVNAPEVAMRKWQDIDIAAQVRQRTGLDVFVENDATSACVAEHLLGRGSEFSDFAYVFIGAFIGGGLVVNGKVLPGRSGNTAALGPMPISDGEGGTVELLSVTSLHVLEGLLRRDGIDPVTLRQTPDDWGFCAPQVAEWIVSQAQPLAMAAAAISSVIEVEAILIDGAMPKDVCARLTQATLEAFQTLELTVLEAPKIEQAIVGKNARSLGAALLPIHARYFVA